MNGSRRFDRTIGFRRIVGYSFDIFDEVIINPIF